MPGAPSARTVCCAEELFTWWHRVRDGTLSRSTLQRYVAELRPWVRSQLEAGRACGCAKTAGTCRELLAVEPALWTFVHVEGVEPTNNHIEGCCGRRAVAERSFGSHSPSGCRWVERLLTVVQSDGDCKGGPCSITCMRPWWLIAPWPSHSQTTCKPAGRLPFPFVPLVLVACSCQTV